MDKKTALGMDPLTWLKSKKKEANLNNNVSKQGNAAEKPSRGSVVNLLSPKQKIREAKTYESGNVTGRYGDIVFGAKKSPHKPNPYAYAKGKSLGGMIFNGVSNEETLVKKPFEPKVLNLSNTAEKMRDMRAYEPSDVTEKYRNDILGAKESGSKSMFSTVGSKKNPATIFVIVYTILLLVLGFLVCGDMSGKINKLEAKITSMEKEINILRD
jgi:hypothetical protein